MRHIVLRGQFRRRSGIHLLHDINCPLPGIRNSIYMDGITWFNFTSEGSGVEVDWSARLTNA
jgi:hypothetical protein